MNKTRLIAAGMLAAAFILFAWLDLGRFLSLDYLRHQQIAIGGFIEANRLAAAAVYFLLYVGVAALSIPGAAVMTLAGGALFGIIDGTVLVSFASTLGATLAFLLARFLLRDTVERRFKLTADKLNHGIESEGGYYLFSLRLVPLFPFFVINLAMGLTRIRTLTFYWVSQIGMLPATIVYVNAGTQLANIDDPADILSPALIFSFALLGLFPLLARKSLELIRNARTR